jgi:hypothetical protein
MINMLMTKIREFITCGVTIKAYMYLRFWDCLEG